MKYLAPITLFAALIVGLYGTKAASPTKAEAEQTARARKVRGKGGI